MVHLMYLLSIFVRLILEFYITSVISNLNSNFRENVSLQAYGEFGLQEMCSYQAYQEED